MRLAKVVIVCYATDHGFVGTLEDLVEPPVHQGQQWFEPKPASMKTEPPSPLTVQGLESCSTFAYKKRQLSFSFGASTPKPAQVWEKKKKKVFESN